MNNKAIGFANLKAVQVLKSLHGNSPSQEEREVLARFTGWGAIANVFDSSKTGWEKDIRDELQQLLSKEEYAEAQASTFNAHYTSPYIVKAMWDGSNNEDYQFWLSNSPCPYGGVDPDMIKMLKLLLTESPKWVKSVTDSCEAVVQKLVSMDVLGDPVRKIRGAIDEYDVEVFNGENLKDFDDDDDDFFDNDDEDDNSPCKLKGFDDDSDFFDDEDEEEYVNTSLNEFDDDDDFFDD